jgi:hypothetical protein
MSSVGYRKYYEIDSQMVENSSTAIIFGPNYAMFLETVRGKLNGSSANEM